MDNYLFLGVVCELHPCYNGETICKKNDTLYVVASGTVFCRIHAGEKERSIAIFGKGSVLNAECVLFKDEYELDDMFYIARKNAMLAEVSVKKIELELNHVSADDRVALISTMKKHYMETKKTIIQGFSRLIIPPTKPRVKLALLEIAKIEHDLKFQNGSFISAFCHEIASLAGCSREEAGRVLKELQDEGFLTRKNKSILIYNT